MLVAGRPEAPLTESLFQAGMQSELDVKQAQMVLRAALVEIPAIEQQIG
jgi:hypothetical protein